MTNSNAIPSNSRFSISNRSRRLSFIPPWHEVKNPRARWILHLQATFWRVLMSLGMFFHLLASPRPPKPNFSRQIPSTIAARSGKIPLHFYTPLDYTVQRKLFLSDREREEGRGIVRQDKVDEDGEDGQEIEMSGLRTARRISASFSRVGDVIRRRSSLGRKWGGYPVVINFHGGGFTLGSASDDGRWCSTVVNECHAVVVSVDYRLAPENPFPTAVEDGVDAVLYIHQHAEELGIDPDCIALSGFSSGANMACSVPLRLYDEIHGFPREETRDSSPIHDSTHGGISLTCTNPARSQETNQPQTKTSTHTDNSRSNPTTSKSGDVAIDIEERVLSDIAIRCIIPWYPSLDYTRTREQRRATCARKDQELPAIFTDLFDESYLHPPRSISLDSPYLSPGVAPSELLQRALPQHIILNTCEWDMLLDEGVAFRDRLRDLGKTVHYQMIEGVPHGWDKAPNPWKPTPGVREHYLRACKEMRLIFGAQAPMGFLEEHQTEAGPSAAPRGSVSVVR